MGQHKLHEGINQRQGAHSGVRLLLAAVVVQAALDCDYISRVGEDDRIIVHNQSTMGYDALNWFVETPEIIDSFISWQTSVTPEAVRENLRARLAPVRAARERKHEIAPLKARSLQVYAKYGKVH